QESFSSMEEQKTNTTTTTRKRPETPAPTDCGRRPVQLTRFGTRSHPWRAWGTAGVLLAAITMSTIAGCGVSPATDHPSVARDVSLERVRKAGVLHWGADVVGGVPYVYEDPRHPGQYIGFEMDIARGVAAALGVKLQLEVKAWDTLIPELQRGSYDMAMNGIED